MSKAPPALAEHATATTVAVPKLLNARQLAGLLEISPRHLARLVHDGEFPRPLLLGRAARWSASDYAAYVERLREKQSKRKRYG